MIALAPAARFTPPTKTSGQDDTQILSFSTSVAKPFVRIKRPISSASLTEPPGELSTTVLMYSPRALTSAAKAPALPGAIMPVAMSRPFLPRLNVIGFAIAPSALRAGTTRRPPSGVTGTSVVTGGMSGRTGCSIASRQSESGRKPVIAERSSARTLTVATNRTRRSQRSIWSSPPPVNQRCSRCRRTESDILRGLADAGGGKRRDVLVVRRCAFRSGFRSRGHFGGRRGRPAARLFELTRDLQRRGEIARRQTRGAERRAAFLPDRRVHDAKDQHEHGGHEIDRDRAGPTRNEVAGVAQHGFGRRDRLEARRLDAWH